MGPGTPPSEWRGYFAAAPTPFDAAGALDLPRLRDVLAWFLGEGAHGLVVNGTTGEWVAQSVSEREQVLETARDVVDDETPLLVGISSIRPDDTVQLGQHAAAAGADGALLTIPPARWLGDSEIVEFFETMAMRIPMPLLIYNVPAVVGYDLPTNLLARLLKIEGIVGVKDNTPVPQQRIETLRQLGCEHHAIFSDVLDPAAFPIMAEEGRGRGQIGSGMPLGSRLAQAFELVWTDKLDEARGIVDDLTQFKSAVLEILGAGQPWHAQIKALMFAAGVDAGFPRFPSTSIRDDQPTMTRLAAMIDQFARRR